MARPVLPTDFKDDVLAESMAGKRRYRIIQNVDGTVSLDDVTDYEQVGSTFGAKQVNDMSSAVNSIEDVKAANNCTTTEPGFVLDARQGKTLMDKSNELSRDLQNKMSKYYGSATLSEANEKAILKHLLLDVDLMGKYGNCNFSVIVNSAQFYSGTMYSDGGVTAWGQIQQRNVDNALGSLYSFYYNRGADPVLKKLGRSGTIAGAGAYWKDPPAGQYREWATGCVRWDYDNLVVTVEDDYEQGHLKVGTVVGKKGDTPNWGDKAGGLLVLKY